MQTMNEMIENTPVNVACRCLFYADSALFAVRLRKWKDADGKADECINELMTGKVGSAYNQQRNQD